MPQHRYYCCPGCGFSGRLQPSPPQDEALCPRCGLLLPALGDSQPPAADSAGQQAPATGPSLAGILRGGLSLIGLGSLCLALAYGGWSYMLAQEAAYLRGEPVVVSGGLPIMTLVSAFLGVTFLVAGFAYFALICIAHFMARQSRGSTRVLVTPRNASIGMGLLILMGIFGWLAYCAGSHGLRNGDLCNIMSAVLMALVVLVCGIGLFVLAGNALQGKDNFS